ncbi:fimbrial protein [Klebsiella pasteurii]|uniref:fimbrial protein n=1 Tax=Klebsiella pasteurii TaxID=2587529 RepID=UPI00237C0254|nr:fimbrial protein [Klebsiella pasteurii]MDD9665718.1 fimbrial protein [Klebsiella pasteurii]MDD9671192.1 fimbrial protein [Klebsiella pasteurii]MDD9687309.1 fimbrial protein [Klebsiella pasteurii]
MEAGYQLNNHNYQGVIILLKNNWYILLIFLPQFCIAGDKWSVNLVGGNMRFQGMIIAEACRIETEDQKLIIKMGKISSNRFHHIGEYNNPVTFSINLKECNTEVSNHVSITFKGVSDPKYPELLSVGEGPEVAKGVAVALFDNDNKLIPVNEMARAKYLFKTEKAKLQFIAKYRTTNKYVTGGKVDAQASFSFTYQ